MRSTVHERKASPAKGKICNSLLVASAPSTPLSSPSALQLNVYTQQLNNSAVSCIEIGLYSRAITSLKRAIQLYKVQQKSSSSNKNLSDCNSCQHTLDECIISSERAARTPQINYADPSVGFISNQPIKVPARDHTPMGPALLIIVSYNLGLVYHLIAMACNNENERKKIIRGSMTSYNLAYETQGNLLQHQCCSVNRETLIASIKSVRFKLMVINNMSQLHKLNADKINHDLCLQILMSIMMVMVDGHVQTLNTNGKIVRMLLIELGGFLRNTSCLILKPKYTADAA